MKRNTTETIIIGGGVAGLGCAHLLTENDRDFIMITEDIGGHILSSEDGRINYGAYFVLNNYKHIMPFIKKGERLKPFLVDFHDDDRNGYRLVKVSRHPMQVLRLLSLLYRFTSTYRKFKDLCENQSQKQVIESDPNLYELYSRSAEEYVKEQRIAGIAEEFLCQGIYMCTFLPLSQVSAFDFLRLCLALVLPAYEFIFLKDKAKAGFADKIRIDSVTGINDKQITTRSGEAYHAENIVVATPPPVSAKLLGLTALKTGSDAYVFHLKGKPRPDWSGGQFLLFKSPSPVIFIREQADGSFIFYSKVADPDLDEYFMDPEILFKKHWDPAFHITGSALLDLEQSEGVYLIGDHNVIGLEDAYITGLLAANRILRNT